MNKILTIFTGVLFMLSSAIFAAEQHGAAALVLKGKDMEAASSELEEAATHGQLRHTDIATEHTEAAVKHIQEGNK